MKYFLLGYLIFNSNFTLAYNFNLFKEEISKRCSHSVPSLLIKKALIEYINTEDCSGNFITIFKEKCPDLSCSNFIKSFTISKQSRSGSVIGDQNEL